MRRFATLFVLSCLVLVPARSAPAQEEGGSGWSFRATVIEACSCDMFCPCYFRPRPTSHFCQFTMAVRVDEGRHGDVDLAGAKYWFAGDLGGDFSSGSGKWGVLTFDPSVTPEQRAAIAEILGPLYPLKWESFKVAEEDLAIAWEATKDRAEAKLGDGKAGEVVLVREANSNTPDPVVITNLKYWGAPRNDGFVLMPCEVEAYRLGEGAFEHRDSNGFMITVDITSED